MENGVQELAAVVLEPAQTRFAPSVGQALGATAISDAELNSTPTAVVRLWAGTRPGVMAQKRPPQRAPAVNVMALESRVADSTYE
ncbi:hypothetical protein FJY68_11315 [candidate division WOR-3 bacterium]|uniref:Uncharacterized protein n=1 Tax=candidate division WOR-3 bacterium TaxID=2052148 RepID=A0A937XI17_UNCW3|nr:hypothetical protein [candidate division WOR-3 bacterium]